MTVWSAVEGHYWSLSARVHWLWHRTRHPSHKMTWAGNSDRSCAGDMSCETCSILLWCRAHDSLSHSRLGQWYCGKRYGHFHSSTGDWQEASGRVDCNGEDILVPMPDPDPPYCMRCDMKLGKP